MSYRTRKKLWSVAVNGMMILVVFFCLFPIVWSCVIPFKTVGEKVSGFNALTILKPTWENYERLFELIPVWQHFGNSLFSSVVGTLTTLFFCSLAGFVFAKYQFPGCRFLFYFVVATMTIPTEIGYVPLFMTMKKLGLINSLWSLILPRLATAVGVFYLRQYIVEVPDEVIEAARIDGCSNWGIYGRVVLPIIKPAIASWAALTLIARWNDFFWPLLYLNKTSKYTLMVSVSMLPLSDGLATPWQVILAGTTIALIPSILMYLVLQGFQKANLTAGAVKG